MVVYHDAACLATTDHLAEVLQPTEGVEVEAADEVGGLHCLCGLFAAVAIEQHFLAPRHPSQKVGAGIGHHDGGVLVNATQVLGPSQGRAHGVAIGTAMAANHNAT